MEKTFYKNKYKILAGIILLAAILFFYFKKDAAIEEGEAVQPGSQIIALSADSEDISEISEYQYTESYSHGLYKFSFKHPKGFVVATVPNAEAPGEVILVKNDEKNIGVQIVVSEYGEDADLTVEMLRSDIPEMEITDPQIIEVGDDRKGVAFISDNKAFGGRSREVWFIFAGELYQISTFAELDGFLKGIFATWKFTK